MSGYANPFEVRIIAVANDMILDRPYRCALANRQQDAKVVNAFVDMMSTKLDIQSKGTFPVMSKTIANSS